MRVLPVYGAFDCHNLVLVARSLRRSFPSSPIVLCADDDWRTTLPDGSAINPGVMGAQMAARAVGNAHVIVPLFVAADRQGPQTDFNDLHAARGLAELQAQLAEIPEDHRGSRHVGVCRFCAG